MSMAAAAVGVDTEAILSFAALHTRSDLSLHERCMLAKNTSIYACGTQLGLQQVRCAFNGYTEASPAGATLLRSRHRIPSSPIRGRCPHLWWTATFSCRRTGAGPGCERLLRLRGCFPAMLTYSRRRCPNELDTWPDAAQLK